MNLFLIAKSNMKKRKSNVAIIFILVAISTMLFYSALNVLLNVSDFLDDKNKSLNGADVILQTDSPETEGIEKIIKGLDGFQSFERHDLLYIPEAKYSNVTQSTDTHNFGFNMNILEDERNISKLNIIDKGKELKDNSIILPAYFNVGLGYKTGDIFKFEFNGKVSEYEVYGFCEDVIYASPSNITIFKCFVPKAEFDKIAGITGVVKENYYTIKLDSNVSSSDVDDDFSEKLKSDIKDYGLGNNILVDYEIMSMGTSMFINIMMGVVSAFAAILTVIAIVVIRFGIVTTIENNTSNIGIYKAEGYTSSQLRKASLIEFMIVCIVGIIGGFLVSGVTSGFIRSVVSSSMGLYWDSSIDFKSVIITTIVIIMLVFVVTYITSSKYKKVTPLDALRNGLYSHNFKKNHVPLSNSVFGVNSSIGIKNIMNSRRQNLTIVIIVALLTFACVTMTTVYYNFVINPSAMVEIVGIEKPEIMITYTGSDNDQMHQEFEKIAKDPMITNNCYYRYTDVLIDHNNEKAQIGIDVYNSTDNITVDTLLEGRRPNAANEVSITNVVRDKINADIGDVVYLELNGNRAEYIVTGITQQISNMGLRAMGTEAGLQRVSDSFICNALYLYTDDDQDIDEAIETLKSKYGDENLYYMNFQSYYDNVLSSFEGAIDILCIVFLVITVLVVTLVTFLLIKIKLMRDTKLFGINKALGYTSKQLIVQMIFSFAPVIIAGTLLGIVLSIFLVSPSFTLMMSASGIQRCNLNLVPLYIITILVVMSLLSVVVCYLSSRKIRKIEPYKIITEL